MIELDDLLVATAGQILGEAGARRFSDFAYDSRRAEPGQLFIAVKSDKGDGHDYIPEAIARGVTGVLCQRPIDAPAGVTVVAVSDTQEALRDFAAHMVRKSGLEVVGVTGSAGKTSTKEMIAAVLATRYSVFKNYGSYNGRYGLPIALARLEPGQQVAVLEMACDGFGEIAELVRIAPPRTGVVTNVSANQIAFFGSLEAIAREHAQLVRTLPAGGLAVLNTDDARVAEMANETAARVVGVGSGASAVIRANEVESTLEGTRFRVATPDGAAEVHLRLAGAHQASNALAALAVGLEHGVSLEDAVEALAELEPLSGRLQVLPGSDGSVVVDDTYSASPAPTLSALGFLRALPGSQATRRIAILGDINDLGHFADQAYREIGTVAAESVNALVTVGEGGQQMAAAAQEAGLPAEHTSVTYTNNEAIRTARQLLQPGDVVLVKGDTEMRMEQVARALLADPVRDGARLPRQEPGWERVKLGLPSRPTWVEIDLDAIAGNARAVKEIVGPQVALMAVLKADAYGHGAVKVARTVLNNGASMLGVASLNEAAVLREAGIDAPVLILGFTPAWQAREAVLRDVRVTVYDNDVARALDRAAADLGARVHVHVKVDTGMGRLGLLPEQVPAFFKELGNLANVEVEGVFTHFSVADSEDKTYTLQQLARFEQVLDELREKGIRPPYVHAANSAGALSVPEARFDMVRVGVALYGLEPSPEEPLPEGFRPALSWKSTIAQAKTLPPGSSIGYGRTYVTTGEERIAVIPVGYADGFRRAPRNWGEVLVKGRRAPLVGRVSMDQAAINVTGIPDVRIGDEVVLIGSQGDERITAEDVAACLGTINYEVVAAILARVPRVT